GKQQTWLTTAASKQLVHKWRSEEQAVMVGKNTALIDNPQLTVREWQGKNPLRIVVDRNMEMPSSLHLFNDAAPTLVFNGLKDDKQGSIEWVKIDFGADAEEQMLKQLYKRNIQSLIIEGGAKLLQSFIQKGLWNEAQIFTSPTALGSGIKAPVVKGEILDNRQIDGDGLVIIKSV
ncbi:MAG: RibD family protein, partial [Bacteroidetes bacterium]|nr:RibD family protein [Bacteroidota bacterium]